MSALPGWFSHVQYDRRRRQSLQQLQRPDHHCPLQALLTPLCRHPRQRMQRCGHSSKTSCWHMNFLTESSIQSIRKTSASVSLVHQEDATLNMVPIRELVKQGKVLHCVAILDVQQVLMQSGGVAGDIDDLTELFQ